MLSWSRLGALQADPRAATVLHIVKLQGKQPLGAGIVNVRKIILGLLSAGALVLILQPIYFAAMVNLDRVISHERTWRHIGDAFASGVIEPGYHSQNFFINGGDRFTDCYALGIGLEPAVSSDIAGINASRPVSDRHSCDDLKDAAANPSTVTWQRYSRYWHGYRLYSAPLASLLPIVVLKLLNLVLLVAVAILFCIQVAKLIGGHATLSLCAPVLFLSDFVRMWQVTPHTVSTAAILGGTALFAAAIRKGSSELVLIVLAAAFGSIFNFVDFLVNPPWMPMLFAFLLVATGRSAHIALCCVAVWFSAYAATWGAKWVAAYLVDPSFDIKSDVVATALFRIAGDNAKVWHFPLAATAKVFGSMVLSWGIIIFVPALIFFRIPLLSRFALAWPALIPIAWFELLSNHSQIHSGFVSRSAAAAVGVLIAAARLSAIADHSVARTSAQENGALSPAEHSARA